MAERRKPQTNGIETPEQTNGIETAVVSGGSFLKELRATVTLRFPEGYIAHPYWPELEKLINIQKMSGMNRARSEDKREQALKEYLRRQGLTMKDYEDLEVLARREWYMSDGEIAIPSHQMYGCLIQSCRAINAGARPCDPDNLRHVLRLSRWWMTGKTEADGVFERLVMPKSGTGQPLSNQRGLRSNEFIGVFTTTGTLSYDPDEIRNHEQLADFLAFAGRRIGVGAARKMGYGRFTVEDYTLSD